MYKRLSLVLWTKQKSVKASPPCSVCLFFLQIKSFFKSLSSNIRKAFNRLVWWPPSGAEETVRSFHCLRCGNQMHEVTLRPRKTHIKGACPLKALSAFSACSIQEGSSYPLCTQSFKSILAQGAPATWCTRIKFTKHCLTHAIKSEDERITKGKQLPRLYTKYPGSHNTEAQLRI